MLSTRKALKSRFMISKKTKYGLKALSFIARSDEKLIPIGIIAKEEYIPHKFLESILLVLRKSGFLGSKKGKGGGLQYHRKKNEYEMPNKSPILH